MEWIKKQLLTLPNQETLAYLKGGEGKTTLILLHGNLSSSYHWLPLVHALQPFYTIYAFDLRGFGDSSYHQRFDDLFTLAHDIILAMNALKLADVVVAGWSAGGGVAMALASLDTRVKKLILLSSMSYRGLPVYQKDAQGKPMIGVTYANKEALANDAVQVVPLVKAQQQQDAKYMKWLWDLVIYTVNKPDPEIDKVLIQESLKQRNLVDLDWAIMNFNIGLAKNDYAPGNLAMEKIKIPILSIWGKQDKTVWEPMVRETAYVFGKLCTLKIYDACGHSPIIDQLPRLTQDIRDFIS